MHSFTSFISVCLSVFFFLVTLFFLRIQGKRTRRDRTRQHQLATVPWSIYSRVYHTTRRHHYSRVALAARRCSYHRPRARPRHCFRLLSDPRPMSLREETNPAPMTRTEVNPLTYTLTKKRRPHHSNPTASEAAVYSTTMMLTRKKPKWTQC